MGRWDLSDTESRWLLAFLVIGWVCVFAVVIPCDTVLTDAALCRHIIAHKQKSLFLAVWYDPTLMASVVLTFVWWLRAGSQMEMGCYAACLALILWACSCALLPIICTLLCVVVAIAYVLYIPVLPFHAARDVECKWKLPAAVLALAAWAVGGVVGFALLLLVCAAAVAAVAVCGWAAPLVYLGTLPGARRAARYFLTAAPAVLLFPMMFIAILWWRHPHLWWSRVLTAAAVVLSLVYAVALRYFLTTLIVASQLSPPVVAAVLQGGWEEQYVHAADGCPVRIFVKRPDAAAAEGGAPGRAAAGRRRWALCLLGNGERMGMAGCSAERTQRLLTRHAERRAVGVVVVHYRGVAQCAETGAPMEGVDLVADARAGYEWLRTEQKAYPEDIAICGYSLGGAVSALLAREVDHPGPLMCDRTFGSLMNVPLGWMVNVDPADDVIAHPDDPVHGIPAHGGDPEKAPLTSPRPAQPTLADRLRTFMAKEVGAIGRTFDWTLNSRRALEEWLAADPRRHGMLTVLWHQKDNIIPEQASLRHAVPEELRGGCSFELVGGLEGPAAKWSVEHGAKASEVRRGIGGAALRVKCWDQPTHCLAWTDEETEVVAVQVEARVTCASHEDNRKTAAAVYRRLVRQLWEHGDAPPPSAAAPRPAAAPARGGYGSVA